MMIIGIIPPSGVDRKKYCSPRGLTRSGPRTRPLEAATRVCNQPGAVCQNPGLGFENANPGFGNWS